jgi:NADH-quinone oxidoreductase subunit C
MALDNQRIQEKLLSHFDGQLGNFSEPYGMLTFQVKKQAILEVIEFLRDDEELRFTFLTDLCGVHFPDNDREMELAVVYHLHNLFDNVRIRIRAFLAADEEIDSLTPLFASANWMERETFDFFGIQFKGHPNLVRILNMDEMEVFPLRKEFPLEDAGRTDKDDRFFGRTIHNE